nr:hypothetical protein [uncultured archaeon]
MPMNLEQLRFKRTNEKGYIFNSSNGDVYELNETSSIIAEGFFNNNLEESIKTILEIYHVDESTVQNDVDEFCKFIREICE